MMEQLEFLQYNATIERKAREQRAMSGEMSQLKRRAKEAGVDLEARAVVAKLAKRDMMERTVFLNSIIDQADAMRLFPPGSLVRLQLPDMTADVSDDTYYADGWIAGNMGAGRDTFQGDPKSAAGIQWNKGYDEAEKVVLPAAEAAEPEEEEAPKRTRRKAKLEVVPEPPQDPEPEPVEEEPLDPADVREEEPPPMAAEAAQDAPGVRPGDGTIAAKLIAQRNARRLAGKYP